MKGLPREWIRGPQWRSEAARLAWGPALTVARDAWHQLEVLSVSEGMRSSAIQTINAADLPVVQRAVIAQGLEMTVLDSSFRVAIHRPGLAPAWLRALERADHAEMARMLGYPQCCAEYFASNWFAGKSETILTQRTVQGPGGTNSMLRWFVRMVPHLPCSGDCAESLAIAQSFSRLATKCDMVEERDAIVDLLCLPVRYSALHGIGVGITPHFRFMTGTDYTASEVRIERPGVADLEPPHLSWEDNGFHSRAAMDDAHAVIMATVKTSAEVMSALDLGCGDGLLLSRLAAGRGSPADWTGVECDPGRASRGQHRHPDVRLLVGRIEDADPGLPASTSFDVVLIAATRFVEMGPEHSASVLQGLVGTSRLVVYSYNEPLVDVVAKAKLPGKLGVVTVGRGAQAADFHLEG
jgi:hypothetical protein